MMWKEEKEISRSDSQIVGDWVDLSRVDARDPSHNWTVWKWLFFSPSFPVPSISIVPAVKIRWLGVFLTSVCGSELPNT